ncbi:hypothetical protein CDD82_6340 [Ophiocordyceps australis]|uniref:Uncharacterized protein n=1 Tax=Ophiocordyceps australis TaxID=1399860 RepID=A0A2C5YQF6_9HYPO|nr:hypothetical protein CDD82_6340 [Ophiocordyceps australis]
MEPSIPSYEENSMVFVFDLHESSGGGGSGALCGSSDDGTHASSVVTTPLASNDDYLQPTPSPPGTSPHVQYTQLGSAPSTLYHGSPEREENQNMSSLPLWLSAGERRGGRL